MTTSTQAGRVYRRFAKAHGAHDHSVHAVKRSTAAPGKGHFNRGC